QFQQTRLPFNRHSWTPGSRTPDSQTPGSRTAVHVLMGEKEKNVWSVVILLKQRNCSLVL
ncbi:hypothetical protein TNCV_153201, partial [Trichonephila clavipes]